MPKYLALVASNEELFDADDVFQFTDLDATAINDDHADFSGKHIEAKDWLGAEGFLEAWLLERIPASNHVFGSRDAFWIEGEIWDTWNPGDGYRDVHQKFVGFEEVISVDKRPEVYDA